MFSWYCSAHLFVKKGHWETAAPLSADYVLRRGTKIDNFLEILEFVGAVCKSVGHWTLYGWYGSGNLI
jgi:hypothetical protein